MTARFIIAALLLLAAAIGMSPVLAALDTHFAKKRIELRASLDTLDYSRLLTFRHDDSIAAYEVLDEGVETEDWATAGFRDPDGNVVTTLITYYSDPRSQVPHTPEVCFKQSGAMVTDLTTVPIDVPVGDNGTRKETARAVYVTKFGINEVVVYVFSCNGRYYHDREQVRLAVGMPGDTYTYFSKIETLGMIPPGTDSTVVAKRCAVLLGELLTLLHEEHFPTADQLR